VADTGSTGNPRLLVVDDEEGVLFLIVDLLRREGYEVEGFDTGEQALEWLAHETPDLLLLDLKLGDLSAPKLVRRLAERGREFPFIIVTGHGDERTAVDLMKQGAMDYVIKDSGMLELLPGIVRRALAVIERDRKLAAANETIRRREERHQHIIQTALDGFVRFEKSGRLLEVNTALCELLGYAPDEVPGKSVFDADGVAFHEQVREKLAKIEQEGAAHCFTRLLRRDGSYVEVEMSLRGDGNDVFGFVHDISAQRRLEREILAISEDERRRFGRELHDGLGQQLTALELMSHALARDLKLDKSGRAKSADEIAKYTRKAITQTRQLAHGLSPVALEAEGLMAALNDLACETAATGIHCDFQCQPPVDVHDPATATHLYRIAQEAVNNALKHAKASQIFLQLEDRGDRVELSIEDNGRGLPGTRSGKSGMGLQVMQHRARLIGGHVTVHSVPKKGVRVVCSVPKQP